MEKNISLQPKRRSLGRRIKNAWQLYLFLLVPVVITLLFKYWPMAGVQIAFKDYDYRWGIWGSEWVGLKHFVRFFKSYMAGRVISNTLRISLYNLACFPFPVIFALLLNLVPNPRYKKLVQSVTYMPHFISTVVLVGILSQILNTHTGLYAHAYRAFAGETANVTDILGIGTAFPHLYVWSGVWQSLGFNSIIYVAALSSVDASLHEAAEIDGANRFQRVIHIDLPAILPTVSIMLILAFGNVMSIGYEKAYLMQNTLNTRYSEIISTYVYKVGIQTGGGNFSFGTAIGLFNSVVNFVLLTVVNYLSGKIGGSSLW